MADKLIMAATEQAEFRAYEKREHNYDVQTSFWGTFTYAELMGGTFYGITAYLH